jgi:hypothetical protein
VSLTEQAVKQLDALADRAGKTRSGLVAELAADATDRERTARRREIVDLLGPPVAREGRVAEHIRSDRNR